MPRLASVAAGSAPTSTVEGETSSGKSGYGGPCPPAGDGAHNYTFRLLSPTESSGLAAGASPEEVIETIAGSAIDSATLTGMYER